MASSLSIKLKQIGSPLILDCERALYWPEGETLFLSDLHLGKVSHFHKAGIALPGQIVTEDYARLQRLMQRYPVKHWICLGDLFHSHWNEEYRLFLEWRMQYSATQFILIEGNHDRYTRKHHDQLNIDIFPFLEWGPFYLIHDWQQESMPQAKYVLSGHLHPCVRLEGKGRQTLKLPCFWFQAQGAYLPAFGQFTGSHTIQPKTDEKIYGVTESEIFSIQLTL